MKYIYVTIIILFGCVGCGGQITPSDHDLQFSEDISGYTMDHYESPRQQMVTASSDQQ